ncbi:MAG: toll/interleukin-1 receptor domain-containing protein [Lachnospiraceae bacterium]|nr:toll/interleukin-1 receptor domain-containing protein [Lachnospiraceae bacterium]
MNREYIAFISYRHCPLDIAIAEQLHRQIERYTIPKELRKNGEKHLGLVFRDLDELPLSSNLSSDIYDALDHSQFLIVICTPETPKSAWVQREIEYFVAKHGHDRVLTVHAAGSAEEAIPDQVTHVYDTDGKTILREIEPLSARIVAPTQQQTLRNLRNSKEFLRLAAAMLGCPYDALRQRQKRYRQQQLSLAFGVISLIALIFIGMLITKNHQIQQQLYQSQINESYALSLLSAQKLSIGDQKSAIQNALAALPSNDSSRPYSPQAEAALANALYVYHNEGIRYESYLTQDTDIHSMCLSPEGTLVATLDLYGQLRLFQAQQETLLWNISLSKLFPSTSVDTPYHVGSDFLHLQFLHNNEQILCINKHQALIISAKDGSLIDCLSYGYEASSFTLSDDETILAILPSLPITNQGKQTGLITFFDLNTGETKCQNTFYSDTTLKTDWAKGYFSPNNALFYISYTHTTATSTGMLVIDSSLGKTLNQWEYPLPIETSTKDGLAFFHCLDQRIIPQEDRSLLLVQINAPLIGDTCHVFLFQLDFQGTILNFISDQHNVSISSGNSPNVLVGPQRVYCVFEDSLLILFPDTMTTRLVEWSVPSHVIHSYLSTNNTIMLILEDGTIHYDILNMLLLSAGTISSYGKCGYHIKEAYSALSGIERIAVIPKDHPNQILILCHTNQSDSIPVTKTNGDNAISSGTAVYAFPSGSKLLTLHSTKDSVDAMYVHTGSIYDAHTLQETDSFVFETPDQALFTGFSDDETHLLFQGYFYDVTRHTINTLAPASYDDPSLILDASLLSSYTAWTLNSNRQWIALADQDNILRIYNAADQSLVHQFSMQLTASSIQEMHFVAEDQALMIIQSNAHATIFDSSNGNVLLETTLKGYGPNTDIVVQSSLNDQSLYILDSTAKMTGLNIATDSWIIKAEIPYGACYLSSSNYLIQIHTNLRDVISLGKFDISHSYLTACPAYTLEQLIERANSMITTRTAP